MGKKQSIIGQCLVLTIAYVEQYKTNLESSHPGVGALADDDTGPVHGVDIVLQTKVGGHSVGQHAVVGVPGRQLQGLQPVCEREREIERERVFTCACVHICVHTYNPIYVPRLRV